MQRSLYAHVSRFNLNLSPPITRAFVGVRSRCVYPTASSRPIFGRVLASPHSRGFASQSSTPQREEMADVEKKFHSSNAEAEHPETDHKHPASHQISDHAEGQQSWKKRPPYRIHDPNEHFKARYEASCHCGKVQYQLSREEPLDSKLCHCTTCQSQHGECLQIQAC